MEASNLNLPSARTEDLIIKELDDEVVVYDSQSHQALCLNTSAAFIWKHCDGRTPVAELARKVETSLGLQHGEDVVRHGLDQLERFQLLEDSVDQPRGGYRVSRRELVGKLGTAALLAIPVVFSLNVPTAAQAGSTGFTGPTGPTGDTGSTGP